MKIRSFREKHLRESGEQYNKCKSLYEAFKKQNKAVEVDRYPTVRWLFGQEAHDGLCCNDTRGECSPPDADHLSAWMKNGQPWAIVSQPYHFDFRATVEWCDRFGLNGEFDYLATWHYPGHAHGLVFTIRDDVIKCRVARCALKSWLVETDQGQPVDGFFRNKRLASNRANFWNTHQRLLHERIKTCRVLERGEERKITWAMIDPVEKALREFGGFHDGVFDVTRV